MELQLLSRTELEPLRDFVSEEDWNLVKQVGRVINLSKVIEAGGYIEYQEEGIFRKSVWRVPKLAIGAMGATGFEVRLFGNNFTYRCWGSTHKGTRGLGISMSPDWARGDKHTYTAELPPFPRKAIEAHNKSDNTAVLWEASWKRGPSLDDPVIIQKIIGNLWLVLYSWDLTDVERKALQASGV